MPHPIYHTLLLTHDGPVATLTLNRPKVLHALNALAFDELAEAIAHVASDPAIRVVLLTGSGEKAFAAGADINELAAIDALSGERLALRGQYVFRLIENCTKPVIACVNGFALGGGCELALACTFRLASENAQFGQPEVKLGLVPGYGGTQRLPRLIGQAAALKIMLTGALVPAAEALRIGLVEEVVPLPDLLPRAHQIALEIAQRAPLAVAGCLEAVHQGAGLELNQALALEARIFGRLSDSKDKREGIQAFLDKRPANFEGR